MFSPPGAALRGFCHNSKSAFDAVFTSQDAGAAAGPDLHDGGGLGAAPGHDGRRSVRPPHRPQPHGTAPRRHRTPPNRDLDQYIAPATEPFSSMFALLQIQLFSASYYWNLHDCAGFLKPSNATNAVFPSFNITFQMGECTEVTKHS